MTGTVPVAVQSTNNNNGGGGGGVSRLKEHYEIEYARFFNYPRSESTTTTNNLGLRPLSRSMKRRQRGGTWLSSSSSASLHLYYTTTATTTTTAHLVLLVYLHHNIYEEHFVSNLHFSWLQVSCVSQCPARGSRVVFASYKDREGQIQKFAMRFLNSSESQTFISSLKESLNEPMNIGISNTYFSSENLYQNDIISANGLRHRADEELTDGYLDANYPPLMESSLNDGVQYACSEETSLHQDYERSATLPRSFTEFLADDCTEAQQEPPLLHEEVDLNTRIAKYMTASSFDDMLIKLEKLINDMGGDLAL